MQACSRSTTGTVCASNSYGSWSACGGFTDTCDRDGTQGRSVTSYACSSGACAVSGSWTETQACGRDTTGAACNDGNACTYSDVCNSSGGCGGTAVSCSGGQVCSGGSCVCPAGYTLCSGVCVNTDSDRNNCGACGAKCLNSDYECNGGSCERIWCGSVRC